MSKVIDVHVHADFHDVGLQWQAQHISRVDFSPQGLLAEMAANGVEPVISLGQESKQIEPYELSDQAVNPMGALGAGNDEPLSRIIRVGGINPFRLGQEGLARIERALQSHTLRGLKIYLGYYPLPPDDDVYKQVYKLAATYDVPVIFHTGDTYSKNAKVRFAHPLQIDDVAVDFRPVRFVLAHLGNPWTMDAAEVVYKNANVYADLSGFLIGDEAYFADPKNAKGIEQAMNRIRLAVDYVEDPGKFMYGSDWPLTPMRPYLALIKRAIDSSHHERVFYANAKEVFKL
jgi:hypothetical protein